MFIVQVKSPITHEGCVCCVLDPAKELREGWEDLDLPFQFLGRDCTELTEAVATTNPENICGMRVGDYEYEVQVDEVTVGFWVQTIA